jgi:hypothetical protein
MAKPSTGSHAPYFQKYIDLVSEDDLQTAFTNQQLVINTLLSSISEEKAMHAYAPGKWTIKELLQHITDTERIFAYRALCIARGEKASLPGFDENSYATASSANTRSWKDIVDEYMIVRKSIEALFNGLGSDAMNRSGISNNNVMSVNSAGFIIVGHFYHHKNILQERYF